MQDGLKAVGSIPYVSVVFFPGLKQNFISYRSSKVSPHPDCILKFTSCDNQAFVRCIPIAAVVGCIPIADVAVHLNMKS